MACSSRTADGEEEEGTPIRNQSERQSSLCLLYVDQWVRPKPKQGTTPPETNRRMMSGCRIVQVRRLLVITRLTRDDISQLSDGLVSRLLRGSAVRHYSVKKEACKRASPAGFVLSSLSNGERRAGICQTATLLPHPPRNKHLDGMQRTKVEQ